MPCREKQDEDDIAVVDNIFSEADIWIPENFAKNLQVELAAGRNTIDFLPK